MTENQSAHSHFMQVDTPSSLPGPLPALRLDLTDMRRGVNNYHIDVRISPKFTGDVRRLVTALLTQATSLNPQSTDHSTLFNALRASYLDIMTVLLHRVKTDLSTDA
ncbi:MAG: hypothetical protein WBJ75_05580, partial [Pseudohongiellaceae bacterium]